jgi:hemerythrin
VAVNSFFKYDEHEVLVSWASVVAAHPHDDNTSLTREMMEELGPWLTESVLDAAMDKARKAIR